MASFNPQDFGFDEPPPRPTTPPVRRGFLVVLFILSVAALLVYGVPYVADRAGYAWEAGRARAATEALKKLDDEGIVNRASALFRLATVAVSPAVVNVHSFRSKHGGEGFAGNPLGGNQLVPGFETHEQGSGFIVDKVKGYIVTNNHVIRDADRIVVRLGPGDDVPARLVGADAKTDLAVLQVKATLKVQANWGDSEQLDIGDWVLAIGSPFGFDHSVTAGIVSATERNDVRIAEYESYIQTDAAINPGNSGGPLINLTGQVVGINRAIITNSEGFEGIGLAIPSSMARGVVDSLIKNGKVVRGWLGVAIEALKTADARKLNLPDNRGALVVHVEPDSPAARAGLKYGDVIVKLANQDVANPAALRNLAAGLDIGVEVPLTLYRDGKPKSVTVKIEEPPPPPELLTLLGFRVQTRPAPDGGEPAVEINQVMTGSIAFQGGLRPGMRILKVGDQPVNSLTQFEVALRRQDFSQGLTLVVQLSDGRVGPIHLGVTRGAKQP